MFGYVKPFKPQMRVCEYETYKAVYPLFNDTATTEIYTDKHTLSLHDALPIWIFRFGGVC